MQEAIGAQYMQRHLPKLEPFLRRVVSTSPRSHPSAIAFRCILFLKKISGTILMVIFVLKSGAGRGA